MTKIDQNTPKRINISIRDRSLGGLLDYLTEIVCIMSLPACLTIPAWLFGNTGIHWIAFIINIIAIIFLIERLLRKNVGLTIPEARKRLDELEEPQAQAVMAQEKQFDPKVSAQPTGIV